MVRTGPKKPQVKADIEKQAIEYYKQFKSAAWAAHHLDCGVHLIEGIYRKYAQVEIEDTNTDFINHQRIAKRTYLIMVDDLLQTAQNQLKDIESNITDTDMATNYDNTKYDWERLKQSQLKVISELMDKKTALELSPTLDISIAAALEEKHGQFSEQNSITNTKESKPKKK